MSEELKPRPYTASELADLLHNERAERAEEINALCIAIGLDYCIDSGSILKAIQRLSGFYRAADAAESLAFYADSCTTILRETHPGKAEALEARVVKFKKAMESRPAPERVPALEHTLRHLVRELAKLDKYRLCMSYNDSYFGEPAGTVKRVVVELRHCIDAAIAGANEMTEYVTLADWEYLQEESSKYPTLADCLCGCHGDYTDHSMRAGESGRCASIIIQD